MDFGLIYTSIEIPYFELSIRLCRYPLLVLQFFKLWFLKGNFQKHAPCYLQIHLLVFLRLTPSVTPCLSCLLCLCLVLIIIISKASY